MTLRSVGSNGGQAAAFTYDLARSVVYTRQGNPAWSGDERDSAVGGGQLIRSDDLFFGAKPGDVQPDWVDLNKVAIPQADEQQRLLTNLIEQMNLDRKPLPRFWFLPRDEKAAVVMTGDDHGNGGTEGRFNAVPGDRARGCSVADWECVRGTSYIYPNTTSLTNAEATRSRAPASRSPCTSTRTARTGRIRPSSRPSTRTSSPSFAANYPSLDSRHHEPHPLHRLERLGDAAEGRAAERHPPRHQLLLLATGLDPGPPRDVHRLRDADALRRPRRLDDRRLPGGDPDDRRVRPDLSRSRSTRCSTTRSAPQGYYGVFTANMHTDNASHSGSDAIVASALARSVPVVSGPPDAGVARRAQRLLLRLGLLEREQAQLQHQRRRRRQRPARDGADDLLGRQP